jgi:Helix-turn-helix domain
MGLRMSNSALTAARKIKAGGPSNKSVLNCIADHANDRGQAWPSVKTIADETELSPDTVRRSLAVLVEKGLIIREQRYRNGGRDSDLITLRLPAPCEESTGTVQVPLPASCEDPPGTVQGPSSHDDTTPPRTVPPQASIEASGKHQGSEEAPQASPAPEGSPKAQKRPAAALTRLPSDWKPADEWRSYARTLGFDDGQIDYAAANFLDHWLQASDSKGKKKDWYAAWRMWVRREIEFKRGLANIPRAQAPASATPKVTPLAARVWADIDSPQWLAWDAHMKAQGKVGASETDARPDGPDTRLRRGWYFESPWPPGHDAEQMKQAA